MLAFFFIMKLLPLGSTSEILNHAAKFIPIIQTMGQVIEISSTGMAFTFVDIEGASLRLSHESILHVDLFAGGRGVFIKNLACKLVSKIEDASDLSFSALSIKRVGVHFEDLSLPQQIQINHLVRRQHLRDQ
jgi:hypothetical protein